MEDLNGDLHAVVLSERGPVDLRAAPRPDGLALEVGEDVAEAVGPEVPLQRLLRLPPSVLPYPPLQFRQDLFLEWPCWLIRYFHFMVPKHPMVSVALMLGMLKCTK